MRKNNKGSENIQMKTVNHAIHRHHLIVVHHLHHHLIEHSRHFHQLLPLHNHRVLHLHHNHLLVQRRQNHLLVHRLQLRHLVHHGLVSMKQTRVFESMVVHCPQIKKTIMTILDKEVRKMYKTKCYLVNVNIFPTSWSRMEKN